MSPPQTAHDPQFEALLEYLKRVRGFDFLAYKRSSLMRRMRRRMEGVGIRSFEDYQACLEVQPGEFAQLFSTILINVTSFFRDPPAWGILREIVYARVIRSKADGEPIRVWTAGCASGEEAFSLAIMMCEQIGVDAFRRRVRIYATDVNEKALNKGRQAAYSDREVEGVPRDVLGKYFRRAGSHHAFDSELRQSIVFGRHDLHQDPPISRIDILTCRNTLMYFNSDARARILERFHFALNDESLLFLGKAELLPAGSDLFNTVDLPGRVYARVRRDRARAAHHI